MLDWAASIQRMFFQIFATSSLTAAPIPFSLEEAFFALRGKRDTTHTSMTITIDRLALGPLFLRMLNRR